MKVTSFVFLAIVGALISTSARCQDSFHTLEDARAQMSHIVADYVTKDQIEALRKLPRFSAARTEEEQRQQVQKYVKWNAETSEKRGASLSYQSLATKTVGDSVARIRFLVLTERLPITFDFFMYRKAPAEPWALADLALSSGAVSLFVAQEQ